MKQIIIFLSILLATQSGRAQDTWNICSTNVTVYPTPIYDSTFVLSAPSRTALSQGQANWTPAPNSGASYRIYTALITQSGASNPVATVMENTLGFPVYWFREGVGWYNLRCDNNIGTCEAFTFGKTFGVSGGVSDDNVEGGGGWTKFIEGGSNLWQLFVYDMAGARVDDGLVMCSIELRIYN